MSNNAGTQKAHRNVARKVQGAVPQVSATGGGSLSSYAQAAQRHSSLPPSAGRVSITPASSTPAADHRKRCTAPQQAGGVGRAQGAYFVSPPH